MNISQNNSKAILMMDISLLKIYWFKSNLLVMKICKYPYKLKYQCN